MSVLHLENVSKSFDGIQAVDEVSIGFNEGKITTLIGPNGAGKTTVFNLISGFLHPDAGAIYYRDKAIHELRPWHISQVGIGRLFQDVRLFDRLTVKENVMAAFRNQKGENALISMVARWKVAKEENLLASRAMKLLESVGLAERAAEMAENLSYGQQKLLAIARLLAADADFILLDEPTSGVSPQMVEKLLNVIRSLAREGKTIVVIEHNINVVMEISDWVYFMDEGQVVSFGLPYEVLGDPEVRAAYVGL
jgi:ABC-type branched-subunit amino acid transport system ATPase component